MITLSSPALFRTLVWTVSHKSLLIRAAKAEQGQNIDLMFAGVFYMQLPDYFHGLQTDTATAEEVAYLQSQCQNEDAERISFYVLCSQGKRYFVGASKFWIERNTLQGSQHHLLE